MTMLSQMPDKLKQFQSWTCEEKPCPFLGYKTWSTEAAADQTGKTSMQDSTPLLKDLIRTEEMHHDYSSFRLSHKC